MTEYPNHCLTVIYYIYFWKLCYGLNVVFRGHDLEKDFEGTTYTENGVRG